MAAGDDALRVLREMNDRLGLIVNLLMEAQKQKAAPINPFIPAAQVARQPFSGRDRNEPPRVASDAELDSQYGDPEVRAKSPRDWTGDSQQGKRFSECPAEYLDLVAERLDYFAGQNDTDPDPEAQKKARWNRLDASRARGWATRIRAGYKPARVPGSDDGPENASPFNDPNIAF